MELVYLCLLSLVVTTASAYSNVSQNTNNFYMSIRIKSFKNVFFYMTKHAGLVKPWWKYT